MGPPPKPNAVRRNKPQTGHLVPVGEVPEKLTKLHKRSSYSAFTQLWWDTWVNSEQSRYFEPTDWLRLQMLAKLVEKFATESRSAHLVLAEIRQNESLLGATIMDRMRLRMRALDGEEKPETIRAEVIREEDDALYAELGGE